MSTKAALYMTKHPIETPIKLKDGSEFTVRSDSLFLYYQIAIELGAKDLTSDSLNQLCDVKIVEILEKLIPAVVIDPPIFIGDKEDCPEGHLPYELITPDHRMDLMEAAIKTAASGGTASDTFLQDGSDAESSPPVENL